MINSRRNLISKAFTRLTISPLRKIFRVSNFLCAVDIVFPNARSVFNMSVFGFESKAIRSPLVARLKRHLFSRLRFDDDDVKRTRLFSSRKAVYKAFPLLFCCFERSSESSSLASRKNVVESDRRHTYTYTQFLHLLEREREREMFRICRSTAEILKKMKGRKSAVHVHR